MRIKRAIMGQSQRKTSTRSDDSDLLRKVVLKRNCIRRLLTEVSGDVKQYKRISKKIDLNNAIMKNTVNSSDDDRGFVISRIIDDSVNIVPSILDLPMQSLPFLINETESGSESDSESDSQSDNESGDEPSSDTSTVSDESNLNLLPRTIEDFENDDNAGTDGRVFDAACLPTIIRDVDFNSDDGLSDVSLPTTIEDLFSGLETETDMSIDNEIDQWNAFCRYHGVDAYV